MSTSSKSTTSSSEDDNELRRGPWTLEEDALLIHNIAHHGEGRWNLLAKRSGLRRTGKSCRLRWLNYLKPDVKRGNLTLEEQHLILDLHSKWGNRWSKIAQYLPGRTDNEIKNYWRTRVQKQAKHLNIDTKSAAFQDIIRHYWMPRLLQKIEGSSTALPIQNSETPLPLDNASQHSAAATAAVAAQISPPPQISMQGDPNVSGTIHGFYIQEQIISDWENYTSSRMDSSESMKMSQISQFSEYPTSPFQAMVNTGYNTLGKGCSNFMTNSRMDSSESMKMSQISQFSEYPTSPFQAMVNTGYNTLGMGCSNFMTNSYDNAMYTYIEENISASGMFENPVGDCHVADNSWADRDFLGSMWNTDELWQYKN